MSEKQLGQPQGQRGVYKPLAGPRDIRLVTIHPGRRGDPLGCSLSHHCLDDAPKPVYSALSYAWGDHKATGPISLDDEPCKVTVNLACALYFLRDAERAVCMWIDALCINQSDVSERGQQVGLIKDIYSGSMETVVFLGNGRKHQSGRASPRGPDVASIVFHGDDRDDEHVGSFWESLGPKEPGPHPSSFHMFCLLRVLGDSDYISMLGEVCDGDLGTLIEDLRLMLNSPWWHRIWVVQEMTVSSRVTVRYGNLQAPWDMFVAAASSPLIQGTAGQAAPWASLAPNHREALLLFSRCIQDCEGLRKEWRVQPGTPLLGLLQDFSNRQASDARDKVYALLGLVDSSQRAVVQPDYLRDVAGVYRQTTMDLMTHTGRLSPWCGDLGRKKQKDLPSWVPDWSAVYEEADSRRAQFESAYNACRAWNFSVVKSRTSYWQVAWRNMNDLVQDIEASRGSKQLPSEFKGVFHFYCVQIRRHLSEHDKTAKMLAEIRERYNRLGQELPSEAGHDMREFHAQHFSLLDAPMESSITRAILRFCHQRLWPERDSCDGETCPGHSWTSQRCRVPKTQASKDDRLATLSDLVSRAEAQYSAYETLLSKYLDSSRTRIREVQTLCVKLWAHCLDESRSPQPWTRRLFSRSMMLYGEVSLHEPVVTFGQRGASDVVPFWTGSSSSPMLPCVDEMKKTRQMSLVLVEAQRRLPAQEGELARKDDADMLAGTGGPTSILSVESAAMGRVARVIGPKLFTWSDKVLSYYTLNFWISLLAYRAPKSARGGVFPPFSPLALARTLVGDARKTDGGALERLGPHDHEALLGWFQDLALRVDGLEWDTIFGADGPEPPGIPDKMPAGDEERRGFDEALTLATEGRVLFQTREGRLGLGPASMVAGDEVRILPGGRTHLVLRRLQGDEAKVDSPCFRLVGDCYLDAGDAAVADQDEEPWRGSLPEEMLHKASALFPTLWEEHGRERIYLF